MEADLRFHAAVADATHNRALVATATALRATLSRALQDSYLVADIAAEQHGRIAEAIAAGDPTAARQRVAEHMDWIEGILATEEDGVTGEAA